MKKKFENFLNNWAIAQKRKGIFQLTSAPDARWRQTRRGGAGGISHRQLLDEVAERRG